jgi:hypothetical protein
MDIYHGLLSIKGFDCVLLDIALQRFHIEPQRSTNLDGRKLSELGLLVDSVHLQAEESGGLLHVQEPLTDASIRAHLRIRRHVSSLPISFEKGDVGVNVQMFLEIGLIQAQAQYRTVNTPYGDYAARTIYVSRAVCL